MLKISRPLKVFTHPFEQEVSPLLKHRLNTSNRDSSKLTGFLAYVKVDAGKAIIAHLKILVTCPFCSMCWSRPAAALKFFPLQKG